MASNPIGTPAAQARAEGEPGAAAVRPYRVAIIGGGCAGVAAAWHIASQPGFEVDLFERSWRLGGKGASGRLADGRIEEHGLHLWMGCYENSFRLVRECYDEVQAHGWGPADGASAPLCHASFDEAFIPEPHVGVGTSTGASGFAVWSGHFALTDGLPGDPLAAGTNPFTLGNYLLRCLDLARTLIQSALDSDTRYGQDPTVKDDPSIDEALQGVAAIVRGGALTLASTLALAMNRLDAWTSALRIKGQATKTAGKAIQLLQALAKLAERQLGDVAALDPQTRAKTEVIDIVLAIAAGLYRDRLLFGRHGFDAINDQEYRVWLASNGARSAVVHLPDEEYRAWLESNGTTSAAVQSRFLQGIYDFAFAKRLAAGVALRSALRMFFTYRGAMFWRMRSGMGDTVFAPLYRALLAGRPATNGRTARSPARIHFMHELRKVQVETAEDGNLYVSRLAFETRGAREQISSSDPTALDSAGCWPNCSEWLLKGNSAAGKMCEMQVDADFDAVVFAMGVEDLKKIFRAGSDADRPDGVFSQLPERWRGLEQTTTAVTMAAQVWLDTDFRGLGWDQRGGVVTALGMGFDTVADMTHTLPSERRWRRVHGMQGDADRARSVAYLCTLGIATDPTKHLGAKVDPRIAVRGLDTFLAKSTLLFPAARGSIEAHRVGTWVARINNEHGSDRYTLAEPGTIATRISPLDGAVANMTIAGDWTACGLDAGCVEAAVMSGLLASRAITGSPALADIVGYDHP